MDIDLNCDMGESFGRYSLGHDEALLRIVTSANIACGCHAGDPVVMRCTVALAAEHGVAVGAHPGYPDLQGFGRRALAMAPEELEASVLYQLGALSAFAVMAGVPLAHVKPHGALYNAAAVDEVVAGAVARAVAAFDPTPIVVTLPGSALVNAAGALGLRVALEGFADRAYTSAGTLVPRTQPGAVIHDPEEAAARAIRMVTEGRIDAITGESVPVQIDTLCVHGDTPNAPDIARALRARLTAANVTIRSL